MPKTLAELRDFIEGAKPLTQWHQTVFSLFLDLHKAQAEEVESGLFVRLNGEAVLIRMG